MAIETREFDVTEYLDSPDMIAAYIEAAMEENDPAFIAKAIGDVARALGMTDIAQRSGMQRETLYKALSERGNPTLATLTGVFDAMGLKLSVAAKEREEMAQPQQQMAAPA